MKILFAVALCSAYLSAWAPVHGAIAFTNIKCTSLDKPFMDFEYCYIKAVNRSYKYFSLKAKLFQVPITNVSITAALLKKANGYKPFLYNLTVDACKFLKSRDSNKVFKFLHGFFEPYSNINHTCPYKEDIVVEKLTISHVNQKLVDFLPLPDGEYMVDTIWRPYNKPRAHVMVQFVKT